MAINFNTDVCLKHKNMRILKGLKMAKQTKRQSPWTHFSYFCPMCSKKESLSPVHTLMHFYISSASYNAFIHPR